MTLSVIYSLVETPVIKETIFFKKPMLQETMNQTLVRVFKVERALMYEFKAGLEKAKEKSMKKYIANTPK